ncbi:tyrosine-type recombinase/integrase [Wolbachia endosymbiont of Pentidionis agamae]|uniref:tyrosine-type recombinase/integrase n=1 Tax=Wolbachia endosymbiont of Pentidionis agamae TaxID=3110435 RepID=UPI002FCF70DD
MELEDRIYKDQGENKEKEGKFYIKYFLEGLLSEKYVVKNTLESYELDLNQLNKFLIKKNSSLITATKSDIDDYMQNFLYKQNYKAASISRKVSTMRHFYKFLFGDHIINTNPAKEQRNPKIVLSLPRYLAVDEMNLLLTTVRRLASMSLTNGKKNEIIGNKRLCAMLEMLYSSGMRVSELTHIKLKDVLGLINTDNTDNKEYFITIGGKGGRERQVFLNEQAVKSLHDYLSVRSHFLTEGTQSEWLFPGNKKDHPITRQRIAQLLKSIAGKLGIKVSPHGIRNTIATHLLSEGEDIFRIMKMLGHSNVVTTQRYTHVANEELKSQLLNLHPITEIVSDKNV